MIKADKKALTAEHSVDVVPVLIMVVDEDLRIKELNGAAREFLGPAQKKALQTRKGEAFRCAHSKEAPAGCGHGRFCRICPIREAVTLAHHERRVVRRRTKAEIGDPGKSSEVHLLVTATPLPSRGSARILLVLEDIDALVELQNPVPICASCKRIRDDDAYWEQMEIHFRQHFDLELSHGICPECRQQLYGSLLDGPSRHSKGRTPVPKQS